MKRIAMMLAFVAACGLSITSAYAGPGCCKKNGQATCTASGNFPKMSYLVGDKEVGCPMAAADMAKAGNTKVIYLVGDKRFDTEAAGMTGLAQASEEFVQRFTSIACVSADGKVSYCDEKGNKACCSKDASVASAGGKTCHSEATATMAKGEGKTCSHATKAATASAEKSDSKGCCKNGAKTEQASLAKAEGKACCQSGKGVKFTVAGRTFDKWDDAVKAREQAIASTKKVSMQYVVDGKTVSCSSEVCPKAKAAGKVQYVVGDAKTNCEIEARINLAKAQFDALQRPADKKVAKM